MKKFLHEFSKEELSNLKVKYSLTIRHGIAAPAGWSMVAVDYKSQELYVAAVVSGDEVMLKSFSCSPTVEYTDEKGETKTVPNVEADLHTLTTASCCYPELFKGKHKALWTSIAKDKSLIKSKGSPRDHGKRANFGILYMQSAIAMARLNFVPKEVTEQWINQHKRLYKGFWDWSEEVGTIGAARGWVSTTLGRIRWVQEANSKGAGESAQRAAVNHSIQGYSADISKLACIRIHSLFTSQPEKRRPRLSAMVHDEAVCCVPGETTLDLEKSYIDEKGFLKASWKPSEEAVYWALQVKKEMELAEQECFTPYGEYPGMADYEIAPYWSH